MSKEFGSESAFARGVNVSQPTINKVLAGKQEPRLEAISQVMTRAGASIVFPWDPKDDTKKISISKLENPDGFRAVERFTVENGAVKKNKDVGMVLPVAQLEKLSNTGRLGVYKVPGIVADMVPGICPDDELLVDFSVKPDKGMNVFLLWVNNTVVCARVVVHDGAYQLIRHNGAPGLLMEGRDVPKLEDAVIGKVVYVAGGMVFRG